MTRRCDECAFEMHGTQACWYDIIMEQVKKYGNCSVYVSKDSCLLCSRQMNNFCVVHSKQITEDSVQCVEFKIVLDPRSIRR